MFDPEKWAVWDYRATIANDGVNSGSHDYVFTPGAGNICVLLNARMLNGDTATRTLKADLRNGDDDHLRNLLGPDGKAVAAGQIRNLPTSEATADDNPASDGSPVILSGVEDLRLRFEALAVSENSEATVQMLVSGGPPTVVLTSPTGATETETENRIV